jgi:hypothetical protein
MRPLHEDLEWQGKMASDQRRETWKNLLQGWAAARTLIDPTFEDVHKHYAEPGRFYHTLDHVMDVLATVESLASHARHLNVVKLAAWLHDVIYDSRLPDNEERSAHYAAELCQRLAIPFQSWRDDARLATSASDSTTSATVPSRENGATSSSTSFARSCTRAPILSDDRLEKESARSTRCSSGVWRRSMTPSRSR